jgi:hypothetical protein
VTAIRQFIHPRETTFRTSLHHQILSDLVQFG